MPSLHDDICQVCGREKHEGCDESCWHRNCGREAHVHCHGIHPRPDDSEKVCWACEKRGRLCEKHAGAYQEVPPRTEEKIDEFNETWPQLFAWSEQREEYVDQTGAVKAFLLSYGKERERKGAWAVAREVERHCVAECHANSLPTNGVSCEHSRIQDAARQVAESFGPDPEGEGK